jgi:glucose 1-dehydrogenase
MDIRENFGISRPEFGTQNGPGQPLAGQKALVTGANSGIGKAVAIALAEAGAAVAINYIADENEAYAVKDRIAAIGGRAITVRGDVSSESSVAEIFEEACAFIGTLDIVVANAGLQRDAPFEEMTLAQWNTVINVNLTGQFLCARAAVREFLRRGPRPEVSRALGKIICMSSVHETIPWAGHANYAASKGGVMMLMKTIAQELAPRGIRVNGLAPGATRTPINTAAWSTPDAYESLMRLVPYKRIGEPEDIARAAVWLASDDSDYVNGVTLFVDGGMTLYPEFAAGG